LLNDTKPPSGTPQGSRDTEAASRHRHEPRSLLKSIEAVQIVPIEDVARLRVEDLKDTGPNRMVGRCVNPKHEDKTPSLVIYKESNSMTCFGCGFWGDVVDLEVYGGYHADTWTAVIALAEQYGIELPQRSRRWHERQAEKHEDRERIIRVLAASYQRRLHRVFAPVILDNIGDPEELHEESTRIWQGFAPVAHGMALRRVGGGS
jgi:hypothetical protein